MTGAQPTTRKALRLMLVLPAVSFDRYFEAALEELAVRGHVVHVAIEAGRKRDLPDGAGLVLSRLVDAGKLTVETLPPSPYRLRERSARALRASLDFLRYLEPEYAGAAGLRARAAARVPRSVRGVLSSRVVQRTKVRRLMARALLSAESRLLVPSWAVDPIRAHRPDVVLVTPVVGLGSHQVEYLRAAARQGIPTVFPVASWDNLTNKGVLRHLPTATLVWNEVQAHEAVTLHGLPRDRVTVTGAHTFDHWFSWEAATSPEEFRARSGLPADQPFVLYVCSSEFVAPGEVEFVREWLDRLRSSGRPALVDAGVLVRPHPQNTAIWSGAALDTPGVVVWPRGGAVPTDAERKQAYFDSIFHCSAVVGINTSAFVEAAIVGRPSLALLDPRFQYAQEGTLHFAYLAPANDGGPLVVGRTWDEHLKHVAQAIQEPSFAADRRRRFIESFVRPFGVEQAAAPRFADAIELAATRA